MKEGRVARNMKGCEEINKQDWFKTGFKIALNRVIVVRIAK